jgi:hypothetical protein
MTTKPKQSVDSKTCPACGGTWPADRRNCLACGANLESVPVRTAGEEQGQEPLNWAWLDAVAEDASSASADAAAPAGADAGTPEPAAGEERRGCLARILPGTD